MATREDADLKAQHGFVYVLGSLRGDDRRTYVGWCVDLDQRLSAHNAGRGARSTRGRCWVLLYAERFETRREAMSREVSLKRDRKFRAALALGLTETR
ncbi:GIY-YIG nuclease family protein [Vitreimonas sp.]|uniref:GIY-YIG nuclease family protein n=1 Tax=Vitreimonas sp. TaxID=3069702 RepID=UPI002ED947C1